jgi:DNA-directed RNA polymerase specialized sigma subunit
MEDVIAKIVDMKAEVNAEIDRLVDLKAEIMQVVKAVEDPELQTLLGLRYLCFKDWPEIACEMHCCESNVYKVHSRALQAVKVPKLGSKL